MGDAAIDNARTQSRGTQLEGSLGYATEHVVRVKDHGVGIEPTPEEKGREGYFRLQRMRKKRGSRRRQAPRRLLCRLRNPSWQRRPRTSAIDLAACPACLWA
jgi:hypothetical protein